MCCKTTPSHPPTHTHHIIQLKMIESIDILVLSDLIGGMDESMSIVLAALIVDSYCNWYHENEKSDSCNRHQHVNESVSHLYEPIYLEVTHEKEINVAMINVLTIILLHFLIVFAKKRKGKEDEPLTGLACYQTQRYKWYMWHYSQ